MGNVQLAFPPEAKTDVNGPLSNQLELPSPARVQLQKHVTAPNFTFPFLYQNHLTPLPTLLTLTLVKMSTTPTSQKSTLYIGNLDPLITSQVLHDAFLPFGEIIEISLPKPELASQQKSSPTAHRGFGYVEFSSPQDAAEAIDNMDQSELFGRVIRVNQAKPQKAVGSGEEGLGSRTAVWEQVSLEFPCSF